MNKDEIIALLQQQNSFLQEQICSLQNQLAASNRKADALLEEVTSLRNLLEHKSEEEAKQKRIIKEIDFADYEGDAIEEAPTISVCNSYGELGGVTIYMVSIDPNSGDVMVEFEGDDGEIEYGGELANLLGSSACNNEFTPEQVRVLQDLVIKALNTSDHIEMDDYLTAKIHKMNLYDSKKKIKDRFAYLCAIIKQDI